MLAAVTQLGVKLLQLPRQLRDVKMLERDNLDLLVARVIEELRGVKQSFDAVDKRVSSNSVAFALYETLPDQKYAPFKLLYSQELEELLLQKISRYGQPPSTHFNYATRNLRSSFIDYYNACAWRSSLKSWSRKPWSLEEPMASAMPQVLQELRADEISMLGGAPTVIDEITLIWLSEKSMKICLTTGYTEKSCRLKASHLKGNYTQAAASSLQSSPLKIERKQWFSFFERNSTVSLEQP